ncbi:MAG: hypothetical protein ACREB9_00365 [Thermoplasmata archaeon]
MQAVKESPSEKSWSAEIWLTIVVAIGVAAGAILALALRLPPGLYPPGTPPLPPWVAQIGVIFSTLSLVLLLALLSVYVRSYRTTRAPYLLGLVIFLVVLFVEITINSPLVLTGFGLGPGILGRFFALGGILMSAALSILLYLSLQ